MALVFNCACGQRLRVAEQFAGKRCQCPACGQIYVVPAPEQAIASKQPTEPPADEIRVKRPSPTARPTEPADLPEVLPADEENTYPAADEPAAEVKSRPPRPRKSGRNPGKKPSVEKGGFFSLERRMVSAGALGGILMMVLAIVWFIAGIVWLDRIFFYPPILFVLGAIAFCKGIFS